MISNTSRYADGTLGQVRPGRKRAVTTHVYRSFSVDPTITYKLYTFKEGDRLDTLATRFFGNPQSWHHIMDINPEIQDAFSIAPGVVIRIPVV